LIRNIIFDFGNVLGIVDFEGFQKNILSEVEDKKLLKKLRNSNVKEDYELGLISSKVFLDIVIKLLDYRITKEKFVFYFNGMLSELPDMKDFLIKLSRSNKYKLLLLSNTNPIHINYAKKKFPYIYEHIKNIILSYKVKDAKPDTAIYLTMLRKYHLKPEESLFIDDLEENCLTAKRLGMHIIQYKGFKSFNRKFRNIIEEN
jgi:HAD superfamily hydrolase (TIGR01509 family)